VHLLGATDYLLLRRPDLPKAALLLPAVHGERDPQTLHSPENNQAGGNAEQEWERHREGYGAVCSSASQKYSLMGPIVRYFEREMLEVGQIQTQVRSVTSDIEKLLMVNEEVREKADKI
jgi:hypothetical protein